MARKTATVTVTDEGRDQGKTFVINEMPAAQAEEWAWRLFLAVAKSGVQVPTEVSSAGLAGVAYLGLRALSGLAWDDAKPLLDEVMGRVSFAFNSAKPGLVRGCQPEDGTIKSIGPLVPSDIEEFATRAKLKAEWFALQTGFSLPDGLLISKGPAGSGAGLNT